MYNELGECFYFLKEYEQKESYNDFNDITIDIGDYTRPDLMFFSLGDFEDSYVQSHQNNTKCSFNQIYDDFAVSCFFIFIFKKNYQYNQ